MRLDLALYELRLFKSRSQATAALNEGRALVNGERTKPSRELRSGDRVTLIEGPRSRTFEVLELPRRSLSREAARALVREVVHDAPRH
jgi:ribosome-associated heat shock protein Hsp15